MDSAQHITCGLWAQDVGTINLPVSPGNVVSGSLCLDTKPPGTAHYFLANQTTGQTINFTADTGFPPAVTVAAGVSRGGWDHPNPALARFGVVYFDEISAYNTNGHQPFPASSDAVTMVDRTTPPSPGPTCSPTTPSRPSSSQPDQAATTANPARERTSQRCSHSATDVTEHEQTDAEYSLVLRLGCRPRRGNRSAVKRVIAGWPQR